MTSLVYDLRHCAPSRPLLPAEWLAQRALRTADFNQLLAVFYGPCTLAPSFGRTQLRARNA